jgi:hypothetical protein
MNGGGGMSIWLLYRYHEKRHGRPAFEELWQYSQVRFACTKYNQNQCT